MNQTKEDNQSLNKEMFYCKNILGTSEAAAFLDISLTQLYKLSSTGKIPSYSPTGGKLYFFREELEQWVLSKRRASIIEINQKATKFLNLKNNA